MYFRTLEPMIQQKNEIITHIGQINSKGYVILQLADLLSGVLAYHHRNLENETMANRGNLRK